MAKVELPESWAGVAQPLCALMAEFDRAGGGVLAHASWHVEGSEIKVER